MRKNLIKETIYSSDGLNHIRAGYYLSLVTNKISFTKDNKVKFNTYHFIWHLLIHIGKYFYYKSIFEKLPKFKKTIWIFDNLGLKKLPELKKKYYTYLDIFHKTQNIYQKIEQKEFWNKILYKGE